ncbi:MAG: hypothetical protein JWP75_1483 [Frondihabitans sp.]|nr:hypothetical protein [Frondihabitans sp.]
MGLADRWRSSHIKEPVQGDFTVAAVRLLAHTPGFYYEYDVDGVVSGPGVTPTPVHRGGILVREQDALAPGQVFPALVDRSDPRRSVVDFPSTKPAHQASPAENAAAAEELAARMASEKQQRP